MFFFNQRWIARHSELPQNRRSLFTTRPAWRSLSKFAPCAVADFDHAILISFVPKQPLPRSTGPACFARLRFLQPVLDEEFCNRANPNRRQCGIRPFASSPRVTRKKGKPPKNPTRIELLPRGLAEKME